MASICLGLNMLMDSILVTPGQNGGVQSSGHIQL